MVSVGNSQCLVIVRDLLFLVAGDQGGRDDSGRRLDEARVYIFNVAFTVANAIGCIHV